MHDLNISKKERACTAAALAQPGEPGWFAVFTIPNHEKKIADYCLHREIERFLPTYTCRRTWKNRQTVNLELPLFPSYLFVRIQAKQRSSVLSIPGVLGVLGQSRVRSDLPDRYIEMLRTGTALQRIVPYPHAAIGDRVRISSGPMVGVEGVLAQFRSSMRVVVAIELVSQSIAIEVSCDEIEPADRRSCLSAPLRWCVES